MRDQTLTSLRRKLLMLGYMKAQRRAEAARIVAMEIKEQDYAYDCCVLGEQAFKRRFDDVRELIEFMAKL